MIVNLIENLPSRILITLGPSPRNAPFIAVAIIMSLEPSPFQLDGIFKSTGYDTPAKCWLRAVRNDQGSGNADQCHPCQWCLYQTPASIRQVSTAEKIA